MWEVASEKAFYGFSWKVGVKVISNWKEVVSILKVGMIFMVVYWNSRSKIGILRCLQRFSLGIVKVVLGLGSNGCFVGVAHGNRESSRVVMMDIHYGGGGRLLGGSVLVEPCCE